MKHVLSFTLNGSPVEVLAKPTDTLLDLLREQLDVMSPKRGCDEGDCGACTVLLDDKPVNACLILAAKAHRKKVITIEGLERNGELHAIQEAFVQYGAVQCGFCTPGMILVAKALLDQNPHPTEEQIRKAISGNLCRCTGYQQIVEAISSLAGIHG